MRFCSENALDQFEFHDAEVCMARIEGDRLIWMLDALNIHKETVQNTGDSDMRIDGARLTFENFRVEAVEGFAHIMDDVTYPGYSKAGAEAARYFADALTKIQYLMAAYDFSVGERCACSFECMCREDFFAVTLTFDRVRVEWDGYAAKAWYELPKWKFRSGRQ